MWSVLFTLSWEKQIRVKNLGHIYLQWERSLLEPFLRHFLSALTIHLYVPYPDHCNWVHSSSKTTQCASEAASEIETVNGSVKHGKHHLSVSQYASWSYSSWTFFHHLVHLIFVFSDCNWISVCYLLHCDKALNCHLIWSWCSFDKKLLQPVSLGSSCLFWDPAI